MKITDFSIIFAMIFMCFLTFFQSREDIDYEKMYLNGRYNVLMDNAVENALWTAFTDVDENEKPVVNLDTVSFYMSEEISVMLRGTGREYEYMYERIKCMVYTEDDGFYLYHADAGWSDKMYYAEKQNTEHSIKVYTVLRELEEKYGIILSLPTNDGETYENTLKDYTLMAVYKDYDGMYCFSAARIKKCRREAAL